MPSALRPCLANVCSDALKVSAEHGDADAILRRLVSGLPFAALVADNDGRYTVVNAAAATLTGYSIHELQHLSVWDLTPADADHDAESLWRAFITSGEQSGVYRVVRADASVIETRYVARAHILPGRHIALLRS